MQSAEDVTPLLRTSRFSSVLSAGCTGMRSVARTL